jgi:hypothetical protein
LKYLVAASLLVALSIPVYRLAKPVEGIDFAHLRRVNYGLDEACEYRGDNFDDKPQCRLSVTPTVALWGDSYAMQWAAGLAAELRGADLIQMTKSVCGPLRGLAIVDENHPRHWAETCIRFNESVFKYISDRPSIKTVVLSSLFSQYTDLVGQFTGLGERSLFLAGDRLVTASTGIATQNLLETIFALRQLGKRVIVIAPPPSLGFNIGECLERRANGVFVRGQSNCNFSYLEYETASKNVIGFLKLVHEKTNVEIIWPENAICDGEVCVTRIGKTILYRDEGHLSYDGSILVARLLNITERLKHN